MGLLILKSKVGSHIMKMSKWEKILFFLIGYEKDTKETKYVKNIIVIGKILSEMSQSTSIDMTSWFRVIRQVLFL